MLPRLERWLERRIASAVPTPAPDRTTPARPDPGPDDVFHAAALKFLDVQVSTNDVIDSRVNSTFGTGSTVLPLTFGLLNLSENQVPTTANWLLGIALFSYVVLLVCAGRASFIRALEYRPDIATLQQYSMSYDEPALKQWVASEYAASIEVNKRELVKKARWAGAATGALYFEGFFLAVAALATILL